MVDAAIVGDDLVQCVAPAMLVGAHTLELTIDSQMYYSAGIIVYLPTPTINSIHPSIGPWLGGTNVSVALDTTDAYNAVQAIGGTVMCMFGSSQVTAQFTTSVPSITSHASQPLIYCKTPSYFENISTTVPFAIKILEESSPIIIRGIRSTNIVYRYLRSPRVSSLSQMSSPATGGTVISIHGSFERSVGSLMCRFGGVTTSGSMGSSMGSDIGGINGIGGIGSVNANIVNATYISATHIRCMVPPLSTVYAIMLHSGTITLPLYITNNGQNYINTGFLYTYYTPAVFTSVRPLAGPTTGGIYVRLRGDVRYTTPESKCYFGDASVSSPATGKK